MKKKKFIYFIHIFSCKIKVNSLGSFFFQCVKVCKNFFSNFLKIFQRNSEKAVFIDQPIPTTSQTFNIQPSLSDDQSDDHSYGRIHYKLDYDFASNKVKII